MPYQEKWSRGLTYSFLAGQTDASPTTWVQSEQYLPQAKLVAIARTVSILMRRKQPFQHFSNKPVIANTETIMAQDIGEGRHLDYLFWKTKVWGTMKDPKRRTTTSHGDHWQEIKNYLLHSKCPRSLARLEYCYYRLLFENKRFRSSKCSGL